MGRKMNIKKMNGGLRISGYERTFNIHGNGMVLMNTDEGIIDYYYELTKLHELIDEKHDQLESGRGNKLKSTDKLFKQRIIDAINKSTVGNISEFSTGIGIGVGIKSFNVNSGIHTLSHALERLGDSFYIKPITGGHSSVTSPSLPSLQILPWNCATNESEKNELKNCMVVYKGFNTTNGCNNKLAGCKVNNQVGIESNGIVHDAGSNELFGYITSRTCNEEYPTQGNLDRNIISGKLDSSSSSKNFAIPAGSNNDLVQTLIPFMNIYSGTNTLIGVIMLYAAPILEGLGEDVIDNYAVFLAFKYIPLANYSQLYSNDAEIALLLTRSRRVNISYLITSNDWSKIPVNDQVPNLPEIADFMAGARGCFSTILRYIISGLPKDLQNKCKPYVDAANFIWGQLPPDHVFGIDQDLFVMAFLMKIKHIGDKFRLIDSFMLSEIFNILTATGTIDTFMMRYACLANLYVYCANKGGDMTINDVRLKSPEQLMAQIEAAEKRAKEEVEAKALEEAAKAEIARQEIIKKCEDKKRNIIGTATFYNELYEYFFELNGSGQYQVKQSSMTRIIETIGIMKEGILKKRAVELKPLRMTNRIVNALLNATNENYVYRGVNFTKKEMSTILTYFLTLLCYFDAFHRLLTSHKIYEMYANIHELNGRTSDIQSIDCNANPEHPLLFECETLINEISDGMNILDKFRLICKFEPKYDGSNNHRLLFDDAFRFLKMKNLDMSLAITYLGDHYLKFPELEYTPNIADALYPQTVGGNNKNQNVQYGGNPIKLIEFKILRATKKINILIENYILTPRKVFGKEFKQHDRRLDIIDFITHLLSCYDDMLNYILINSITGTESYTFETLQISQTYICRVQEFITLDTVKPDNEIFCSNITKLPLIIPETKSVMLDEMKVDVPETKSVMLDKMKFDVLLDSINKENFTIIPIEKDYLRHHDDLSKEIEHNDNITIDHHYLADDYDDYDDVDLKYFDSLLAKLHHNQRTVGSKRYLGLKHGPSSDTKFTLSKQFSETCNISGGSSTGNVQIKFRKTKRIRDSIRRSKKKQSKTIKKHKNNRRKTRKYKKH